MNLNTYLNSDLPANQNPNLDIIEMEKHLLCMLDLIKKAFPGYAINNKTPELYVHIDYWSFDPCGILYFHRRMHRSPGFLGTLNFFYRKIEHKMFLDRFSPGRFQEKLHVSDYQFIETFLKEITSLMNIKFKLRPDHASITDPSQDMYTLQYYIEIYDRRKYYKHAENSLPNSVKALE